MTIPIALKAFLWIVFLLEPQKINELRVAGLDLISVGPAMIGEVIRSTVLDHTIDNPPEIFRGLLLAGCRVDNMEVADDADRRLAGPGEKTFGISLNEADCAIGHIDLIFQKVLSCIRK